MRCCERALGGRHGGLGRGLRGGRHGRRVYTARGAGQADSGRIRLDLNLRSKHMQASRRFSARLQAFSARYVLWRTADAPVDGSADPARCRRAELSRQSAGRRARRRPGAGQRVAERFGADRDDVGARVEQVARVASGLDAAHPDDRDRDARRGPRRPARARRRGPPGPDTPPVPPPSHGSPRRAGAAPSPRSVLISETASAPAASTAAATVAGRRGVRRQLDDQRLAGQRADARRAARRPRRARRR